MRAGWSLRQRYRGCDLYFSNHATAAAADKAARQRCQDIDQGKLAAHGGAGHDTGQALQDYAVEWLPCKQGAEQ